MVSLIRLGITALAVLVVVVGNTGLGWAGINPCGSCTIKIDDLTETPSVQVFSGASPVTGLLNFQGDNNPAGEFLHFTLPLPVTSPPTNFPLGDPAGPSFYRDMFEDSLGGTLSDRLLLTLIGDVLDVQFASDPASIILPPGVTHLQPDLVENGDFQSLVIVDAAGPPHVTYEFLVRSDVDVPAPATLLLIGSGLAGLGALGWRRKRG